MNYPYPHHSEPYYPWYRLEGPRMALGSSFPINLPVVGNVNVDIPVEQMAQVAAKEAVNAAWPELQRRLYAELPRVVNTALDEAQPRIREELDRATAAATSRAVMVGTALAVIVIGAAWWTRSAVKGK